MTLKKVFVCCISIFIILTTASCWDSMDIDSKALISLVITDKQDDEFVFYVEVPNLEISQTPEGGSGKEQYSVVNGRGKNYMEARQELDSKMDKLLFLGTVGSLVLTKNLITHGLEEYMLRLQNTVDYRKALNIVTTFEKPEDLLSPEPENNISIGYSIQDTLNTLSDLDLIITYTTSDILDFMHSDYCFILPNIDLKEGRLAINGYTIIHENKYLNFIPLNKSKGVLFILEDKATTRYVVPFDKYEATVEVRMKKRKIRPNYLINNISYELDFTFNSKLIYLNKDITLDKTMLEEIKKNLEELILKDISEAIKNSKSLQCDYLGFKEQFRIRYPNEVKTINWEPTYKQAQFDISIKTSLNPGGMIDYTTKK